MVSIYTEEFEHKTFTTPPKPEVIINYLHKNFPGGSFKCVYEAGYSGYWIQQSFTKVGIDCIIVNPADIPIKDKEKRFKNDTIDSRKLARTLRSGEIEGIHIPKEDKLQDRSLVRLRHLMVKKLTRTKNQIKAHLSFYGIDCTSLGLRSNWSHKYIEWLESICENNQSNSITLKFLIEDFKQLQARISEITKQIKILSETETYRIDIENLLSIPGIGILTGMIILTEIGNVRRFKDLDRLNSYVGLIPGEYSSGDSQHITGIIHRGNSVLRRSIVEAAWVAVKRDTALLSAFKSYSCRMQKNKAIIKIARRLLNRIRYVLINKQKYIEGIT